MSDIKVTAQIEASNSDLLEALASSTAVTGRRPGEALGLIEIEITINHMATHEAAAHWLDTFLTVNDESLVSQPSQFAKFQYTQNVYIRHEFEYYGPFGYQARRKAVR